MRFTPGKTLVHVSGQVTGPEETAALIEVARKLRITAGPWHHALETGLAEWCGMSFARLVNSGSSANLLAIAALMDEAIPTSRRLVRGDGVVTCAAGFPTTIAPIVQLGLVPIFVDCDRHGNIRSDLLDLTTGPVRVGAVIAAHTLGNPFDVASVRSFCDHLRIPLIEDCCDALGSTVGGRKVGTFGDLATLSFYPAHHMTTGEGGAVLTGDPTLAEIVTSLRDWGRSCYCPPACDNTCGARFDQQFGSLPHGYDHKYVYQRLGYNLKVTEMQAAIGLAQLVKLDGFITRRRDTWAFYRRELADLAPALVLPDPTPGADPSWFGFLLRVPRDGPQDRGRLARELEARRIQTRPLFAGNLTRHPAMSGVRYRVAGDLLESDAITMDALWVGVYPGVTDAARAWVVESIHALASGGDRL